MPTLANHPSEKIIRARVWWMLAAMSLLLLAVLYRYFRLEVVEGARYREFAANNRIERRADPAPRGLIFDRKGRVIVKNQPNYELYFNPSPIDRRREDVAEFADAVGMSRETLEEIYAKIGERSAREELLIAERLDRDWVGRFETDRMRWPSLNIRAVPRRHYPNGSLLSHFLGHLTEIDEKRLRASKRGVYAPGDLVGASGLEGRYEEALRGVPGKRAVLIDARGHEVTGLSKDRYEAWLGPFTKSDVQRIPGADITLEIDLDLQREAERLLEGHLGALIVLQPRTGALLASASSPGYPPETLNPPVSKESWRRLAEDPRRPLVNKAIREHYPPGSIYKVVTALAALEAGVVQPDETVNCTGRYKVGDRSYRCWRHGGHGETDLHRALVESCDVYFYEMGMRLGVDRLAETAHKLGLGQPTGLDPESEIPGVTPTRKWKLERFGQPWFDGETTSVAIGQGYNLVTPLQMAKLYAYLAIPAGLIVPNLIQKIDSATPGVETVTLHPVRTKQPVDLILVQRVRQALLDVVQSSNGTGKRARIRGVSVAGKTGTAQVVRQSNIPDHSEEEEIPVEMRDHAWFAAFAPYEAPEIAVVALVLHGGHGGATAAPIAREIMQTYFALADEEEAR